MEKSLVNSDISQQHTINMILIHFYNVMNMKESMNIFVVYIIMMSILNVLLKTTNILLREINLCHLMNIRNRLNIMIIL